MGGSWRNPKPAAPVARRRPLHPELTVLGTPHEMSYLTNETIQDGRTRRQESANQKSSFPQAIRKIFVKGLVAIFLTQRHGIDSGQPL
jgi:hypothetical protein